MNGEHMTRYRSGLKTRRYRRRRGVEFTMWSEVALFVVIAALGLLLGFAMDGFVFPTVLDEFAFPTVAP